ncbi:MAG: hypothetical protein PVI78_03895 [Anaerolineales bacterium]
MSRKTTIFLTVLITVVAIAVLAGGGYALYRLGYARGQAAESGGLMWNRLMERFPGAMNLPELRERLGDRFPGALEAHEMGEHIMAWPQQNNLSHFPSQFGFSPFSILIGGFHLLIGAGVLALAVYGAIHLVRSGKTTAEKIVGDT